MENVKPTPRGISLWKKAALKSYVERNDISIEERTRYTRKDYIRAIKAEESKYKNLPKKTLDDLKQIVDDENIDYVPTGYRGRFLRKDLISAIKRFKSPQDFQEAAFRATRRFKNSFRNWEINPRQFNNDVEMFFRNHASQIKIKVKSELEELTNIKLQLAITIRYVKSGDDGEQVTDKFTFISNNKVILRESQVEPTIKELIDQIKEKHASHTNGGSGWVLDEILAFYINVNRFNRTRGSSDIDLPAYLTNKKAIINVQILQTTFLRRLLMLT